MLLRDGHFAAVPTLAHLAHQRHDDGVHDFVGRQQGDRGGQRIFDAARVRMLGRIQGALDVHLPARGTGTCLPARISDELGEIVGRQRREPADGVAEFGRAAQQAQTGDIDG